MLVRWLLSAARGSNNSTVPWIPWKWGELTPVPEFRTTKVLPTPGVAEPLFEIPSVPRLKIES